MHFAVGFWFIVVREAVFLSSGGSRECGAQKMLKKRAWSLFLPLCARR